jgi:integron integrase
MSPKPPVKLLDRVRQRIRLKGYSIRTEKAYSEWIKRYILFHNKRHPNEMGKQEIEAFLSHLVVNRNVAPSTQNQAFNAILFLYEQVLEKSMPEDISAIRSKKPARVPTVMTPEETRRVISAMQGTHQLMAEVLYGCGLRLIECVRLRVKDIDFALNQVIVRDGKGHKDRITVLPRKFRQSIQVHLIDVRKLHEKDLQEGYGRVFLPYALARKFPGADRQWGWQYVFPSKTLSVDPRSGIRRRHHIHGSSMRKSLKAAARQAGIVKPISCHTLRHSFATDLLANGYDIRTIQDLLGHKDVSTTMVYTHVLNRGGKGVVSPLDTGQ